jgi:ssRNA-specific RNase YbeY (16S rRNA maturation enzyme)
MNQLTLEDMEKLIGRIIISNYQMEQQATAQLEKLQQENQRLMAERQGAMTEASNPLPK